MRLSELPTKRWLLGLTVLVISSTSGAPLWLSIPGWALAVWILLSKEDRR